MFICLPLRSTRLPVDSTQQQHKLNNKAQPDSATHCGSGRAGNAQKASSTPLRQIIPESLLSRHRLQDAKHQKKPRQLNRLSVRHREVLIRWHLTAPARKAGRWRGPGTRSAAATLDACRALLADHLSYGGHWGNPPAGA
ncbi:unnamed protein product [Pleuronectes platessa]|uniref:Uncharacterized protein n=1 Tax=Pleuronectes platessa TaxID=8262 RepID=A0A9N7YX92_PLEPL|nr:unnamed protein product [Pleuronectes platessa]